MSRRKQQKPRHLDGETPDLTAVLPNDGPIGQSMPDMPELEQRLTATVPDTDDVTLCERCQVEFSSVEELKEHTKVCTAMKVSDDIRTATPSPIPEEEDTEKNLDELDVEENTNDGMTLDGEKVLESPVDEQLDTDMVMPSDKSDNFSDTKSEDAMDPKEDSLADPGDSPADTDGEEAGEKMSSMMSGMDFPGAMPQIPPLISAISDSNVKLEKLESTKVAVAQFAENNLSNLPQMDLPALQTMLVSLQQQQLMQLQLLQQLQQQLLSGVVPPALAQLAPIMTAMSQGQTPTNLSLLAGMTGAMNAVAAVPPPPPPAPPASDKATNLDRADRPFKCTICSSRFSSQNSLDIHLTKHKTTKVPHGKIPDAAMRPSVIPPLVPAVNKEAGSKEAEVKGSQVTENAASPMSAGTVKPEAMKGSEAPKGLSPDVKEMQNRFMPPGSTHMVSATLTTPTPSVAAPHLIHGFHPSLPPHPMAPFGFEPPPFMRPSILPQKEEDPMEQYMEITKSETSKLQQLVENIETKLTDPNQCAICQRILSCKSALQMHYRTHTGERPFKCKICGRAFTTKGNLKTHMGVHRAKPPVRMLHQCPVCHKQFTNALVLQQHIRMHTGELPKDMPMLPEMMPGPYMPFHGFPFMPPMFPHQMSAPGAAMAHLGASGELDLRKPSGDERPAKMPRLDDSVREEINENKDHSGSDGERDNSFKEGEESHEMEGERSNVGFPDGTSSPSEDEQKRSESDQGTPSSKEGSSPFLKAPGSPRLIIKPDTPAKDLYSSPSSVITSSHLPSSYSTSLMALEERVKAIESPSPLSAYSAMQPLEHMASILRRPDISMPNGNHSPHSGEEGSEGQVTPGSKEGSLARSPAASISGTSPGLPGGTDSNSESMDGYPLRPGQSPLMAFPGMSPLDLQPKLFDGSSHNTTTTCNICYKTFACRSALDIHYRSHTKERPFRCDVCERAFTTKGNMRQHMLTHKIRDIPNTASGDSNTSLSDSSTPTKVKEEVVKSSTPLTPDQSRPEGQMEDSMAAMERMVEQEATRSVTTPSLLLNMPVPTSTPTPTSTPGGKPGESPFVKRPNLKHMCQICQKPFSSASALQIHMRTHTGDKPFKCTICGKAFTTKGNLKVHMGTHMWNNQPSRRGRRMSIDNIPPGFPPPPHHPGDKPEFYPGFPPRPPTDMYPFPPFPGFHNGFSPKMNEISVIQSLNGGMGPLPPTSLPSSMAEVMKAHQQSMADAVKPLPPTNMAPEHLLKSDFMKSEAMKNLMKNDPPKPDGMKSPMKPEIKGEFMRFDHMMRPDITAKHDAVENNNNTPINGGSGELDLSMHKSTSRSSSPPGGAHSPHDSPVSSHFNPAKSPPPRHSSHSPMSQSPRNLSAASPMSMPLSAIPPLHFSSPFPPPPVMMSIPSSLSGGIPLNMTNQTSPNSNPVPGDSPTPTSIHMSLSTQSVPSDGRSESPQNPAWAWKTTCHICNKTCPSAAALEMHMKGHLQRSEQSSPTPLMT